MTAMSTLQSTPSSYAFLNSPFFRWEDVNTCPDGGHVRREDKKEQASTGSGWRVRLGGESDANLREGEG